MGRRKTCNWSHVARVAYEGAPDSHAGLVKEGIANYIIILLEALTLKTYFFKFIF